MSKLRTLTEKERAIVDRIKEAAARQGLTMAELARRCGLTANAASQWGAYNAMPSQRNLVKIAFAAEPC